MWGIRSAVAGIVFINPASGPDDAGVEVRERFAGHAIEEADPEELAKQVGAAVHDRPDFIGVAGGDGTIRSVAQELVGGDVPLLAIPAGTRNHFARDLCLDTIEKAAAAVTNGTTRSIDVGRVNGQVFVNNSSIGAYPKIVVRREVHEKRVPKRIANIAAAYEQLRHGRRLTVEVDGETLPIWLSFIGNGRYGDGLWDLADRESLDEHVLDVRLVHADRPLARLRVIGALLLGRLARSPLITTHTTSAVTLDLDRAEVEVALDGEVDKLRPPLRYESVAGGLLVLVPPDPETP
jgi:diacylglycerol kinase family enzyme